jgi:hypothetical protein
MGARVHDLALSINARCLHNGGRDDPPHRAVKHAAANSSGRTKITPGQILRKTVASIWQSKSGHHFVARRMAAGEQLRAEKKYWRFLQLIVGLVGYGTSVTILVKSSLGASSWNILAEGISLRTGLTFGWATNLTAVAVLFFWIPLRERPGIGTVLNVVLVG